MRNPFSEEISVTPIKPESQSIRLMAFKEDIPKIAFGTTHIVHDISDERCKSKIPDDSKENAGDSLRFSQTEFRELIRHALDLGYRHFDCAPLYGTQKLVGECLAEAVERVPRQRLFLTSKLPPNMMRPGNIKRSITQSIGELRCCYLDLFLVHAPFATEHVSDENFCPVDEQGNLLLDDSDEGLLEETWREVAELKKLGLTRYVGLSNVNSHQIMRLHKIHPVDVVQNEYHIYNQNRDLLDFCEEIDIHFEAYAIFGNPNKSKIEMKPNCMSDPVVRRISKLYGLTPAETVIQWIHNQPLSYVFKCDTKRQLEENINATKFNELSVEALVELDSLDKKIRVHSFEEYRGISRHREYPFNQQNMLSEDPDSLQQES